MQHGAVNFSYMIFHCNYGVAHYDQSCMSYFGSIQLLQLLQLLRLLQLRLVL